MAAKDQDAFGSFPPVLVNNMSLAAMYSMPRASVLFMDWLDTITKMRVQASSRTWLSRNLGIDRELLIDNCRFTQCLWCTELLCSQIWQRQVQADLGIPGVPSREVERWRLHRWWADNIGLPRRLICREIRGSLRDKLVTR